MQLGRPHFGAGGLVIMDSNGPQGRGELLKRCQEEKQLVRLRKKIVGYCGLTLCVWMCLCVCVSRLLTPQIYWVRSAIRHYHWCLYCQYGNHSPNQGATSQWSASPNATAECGWWEAGDLGSKRQCGLLVWPRSLGTLAQRTVPTIFSEKKWV